MSINVELLNVPSSTLRGGQMGNNWLLLPRNPARHCLLRIPISPDSESQGWKKKQFIFLQKTQPTRFFGKTHVFFFLSPGIMGFLKFKWVFKRNVTKSKFT